MTVFHHAIKSLGTNYDPLGGKTVAHIAGGGAVGNTAFHDISVSNTPCVTLGDAVSVAATLPWGAATSVRYSAANGLVLSASDGRYKFGSGLTGTITIDGWFLASHNSTIAAPIWNIHTTGGLVGWTNWAGGNTTDNTGLVLRLLIRGASTAQVVELMKWNTTSGGGAYTYCSVALGGARYNKWLYYHLVIDTAAGTATLRVDDANPVTSTIGTNFLTFPAPAYSIMLGGAASASASFVREAFAFRLTKELRPYDATLRTRPWPAQGGTPNWLGAPADAATPLGQKVLGNAEVWVVPAGISHISAVAVGCKLSIAGTDVLAATWPVLGDGGGQGGAGGTGHSETVESWSNGPPAPGGAFGGTPGTIRSVQTYNYYGGGGGAGGYTGKGGNGVSTQGATASSGQGGGGGGGATQAPGGGVGLKGQGASGVGNHNPGKPGSATGTTYGGGLPGAGATLNGTPGNNLAWRNNIPVTQGQVVLCTYIGESGQTGAARIMWGDARSYPDNAGDVE